MQVSANVWKRITLVLGGVALCIAAVFLIRYATGFVTEREAPSAPQTSVSPSPSRTAESSGPAVVIHGARIAVRLATTTLAQEKGLSGQLSLGAMDGMLFLFANPAFYRFWMPDMHFPLDMIWINEGVVIDITENATTTFDAEHPKFYSPQSPAKEVLEVNAGFSAAHGIRIGDAVRFENIP